MITVDTIHVVFDSVPSKGDRSVEVEGEIMEVLIFAPVEADFTQFITHLTRTSKMTLPGFSIRYTTSLDHQIQLYIHPRTFNVDITNHRKTAFVPAANVHLITFDGAKGVDATREQAANSIRGGDVAQFPDAYTTLAQ